MEGEAEKLEETRPDETRGTASDELEQSDAAAEAAEGPEQPDDESEAGDSSDG